MNMYLAPLPQKQAPRPAKPKTPREAATVASSDGPAPAETAMAAALKDAGVETAGEPVS
jgi:hypothetical protein